MLDRSQARCVSASPLARQPFGQNGIQLAAVEIAKAIATGFATDLSDHIISLDLLDAGIAKHYVAPRPQCPSCGRKKLRDPRRAPVPIELAAGGRLVMTSGGYRTVSPRDTVARFRKHVSPLTGVISALERIDADVPMNTNYYAAHNFSAPARNVDELREGLSGGSFGKGSTPEQGEASALMEAMERYSGNFSGRRNQGDAAVHGFPPGDAIAPNDVMLFSDAQFARDRASITDPIEARTLPEPFDRSAKIDWSPVWSLRDQRFRYLPTSFLYFFYRGPGEINADSNGCAAGNTLAEAIVQGFLELVERDSYAIWWYNRLQRTRSGPRPVRRFLHPRSAGPACRERAPALGPRHHQRPRNSELCRAGALDRRRAGKRRVRVRRAFRSAHRRVAGAHRAEPVSVDRPHGRWRRKESEPRRHHAVPPAGPCLSGAGRHSRDPARASTFSRLDTREQVAACVEAIRRAASTSSFSTRRGPTSAFRSRA